MLITDANNRLCCFTNEFHGIRAREISLLQDLRSSIIGLCPFMFIFLDARLVR